MGHGDRRAAGACRRHDSFVRVFDHHAAAGIAAEDPTEGGPPTPLEELERKRAATAARRILDSMSDRLRVVLVLYEVEGFKHREIADMLGIPEGTSKNTLFRARRELREMILSEDREVR